MVDDSNGSTGEYCLLSLSFPCTLDDVTRIRPVQIQQVHFGSQVMVKLSSFRRPAKVQVGQESDAGWQFLASAAAI